MSDQLNSVAALAPGIEENFDRITRMARQVFDVPIALVSLVDRERLWFKSRQDLVAGEALQTVTFCSHVLSTDEPFVVEDAQEDQRFRDDALVTGEPRLRFYAGVPLGASREKKNIGTLCLIDTKPRTLTPEQLDLLGDLAAGVMSEIELRKLSIRDPLTNTFSRIEFRRVLDAQIANSRETSKSFGMIMIGIDHFSWLNDTFGYDAGNIVLKKVAERCQSIFPLPSIVARYSGKQFAIILPHDNLEQTVELAECIWASIANVPFEDNCRKIDATASIGVAAFSPRRDTSELIMARLSLRMEAAKRAGRNQIVHSDVLGDTSNVA